MKFKVWIDVDLNPYAFPPLDASLADSFAGIRLDVSSIKRDRRQILIGPAIISARCARRWTRIAAYMDAGASCRMSWSRRRPAVCRWAARPQRSRAQMNSTGPLPSCERPYAPLNGTSTISRTLFISFFNLKCSNLIRIYIYIYSSLDLTSNLHLNESEFELKIWV